MLPPVAAQPAEAAVADAVAVVGGGKPGGIIYMQTMRTCFSLLILFPSFILSAVGAAQTGKAFNTPQDAVNALGQAVEATNRAALVTLFGEETERLANPDTVQGAQEIAEFAAAFNATN